MKNIVTIVIVLFAFVGFAQDNNNVKLEKNGDLTEATYFYADGSIQQQGTFNADGKLHGVWTSYDANGNKLAVGKYENGKKVGTWIFWRDGEINEVSYVDSKIMKVDRIESGSSI